MERTGELKTVVQTCVYRTINMSISTAIKRQEKFEGRRKKRGKGSDLTMDEHLHVERRQITFSQLLELNMCDFWWREERYERRSDFHLGGGIEAFGDHFFVGSEAEIGV